MKKAITILGAILILASVSWIFPGRSAQSVSAGPVTSSSVQTVDGQNQGSLDQTVEFKQAAKNGIKRFWQYSGFDNASIKHLVMILIGLIFLFLAIRFEYEPLLLVPIGMGILIGNIPFMLNAGMGIGIYEK